MLVWEVSLSRRCADLVGVLVFLFCAFGCDEANRLVETFDLIKKGEQPPASNPKEASGERLTERGAGARTERKVRATPPPEADAKGTLVDGAEPGTAEALIQGLIEAASEESEAVGWQKLKPLLHSKLQNNVALEGWRNSTYRATRRKVWLYVQSKDDLRFRIVRKVESEGEVKAFVYNRESSPTPCTLARDPAAGGAWRIRSCSL